MWAIWIFLIITSAPAEKPKWKPVKHGDVIIRPVDAKPVGGWR